MAKTTWKDLVERDAESAWKAAGKPAPAPVDHTQSRRDKVMFAIDQVLQNLDDSEAVKLRGWHKVKGDMARVSVKLGNKVVQLGGRDWQVVPEERAMDFFHAVRSDVEAGNLDREISAAAGGEVATGTRKRGSRAGGDWTPERRAAYAEKMAPIYAARKAAKEAKAK